MTGDEGKVQVRVWGVGEGQEECGSRQGGDAHNGKVKDSAKDIQRVLRTS